MEHITFMEETFKELVHTKITRPGIEKLMEWLDTTDFYIAPASTKYHGSRDGGLVEHSLDVYDAIQNEADFLCEQSEMILFNEESLAIVSLFHDLCKVNRYQKGTRNVKNEKTGQWDKVACYNYVTDRTSLGHGAESCFYITQHMQLTRAEWEAIYWHMGAYDLSPYSNVSGLSDTYAHNMLAFALHRADMLSTYVYDNEANIQAEFLAQQNESDN